VRDWVLPAAVRIVYHTSYFATRFYFIGAL